MPRRTSSRKASLSSAGKRSANSPHKNQSSISDFFSARPSPVKPKTAPSSTVASFNSLKNDRDASPPVSIYRSSSPSNRPRDCSTLEHARLPQGVARNVTTLDKMDVDSGSDEARGGFQFRASLAEDAVMPANSSLAAYDDAEEPQLTQEELDVNHRFEALECSRDGFDDEPSPSKRTAERRPVALQKRMRTAASSRNDGSAPGPNEARLANVGILTGTGFSPDLEEEDGSTPPGMKSVASPISKSSASDRDESEDDSYADLRRHDEALAVRRSSRISKEVVRYDPDAVVGAQANSADLFGDALFGRKSTNSGAAALRLMAKERLARAAEESQIEKMREGIKKNEQPAGEDEFQRLAEFEDQAEQQRQAQYEKYSAPVSLFSGDLRTVKLPEKYLSRRADGATHELQDILLEVFKSGEAGDIALSLIGPCISRASRVGVSDIPPGIQRMLFHALVYDPTTAKSGLLDRDNLTEHFKHLIYASQGRRKSDLQGQHSIPSLISVLESFGCNFKGPETDVGSSTSGAARTSLDKLAKHEVNDASRSVLRNAKRNLSRALEIAAARIRCGEELSCVICPSLKAKGATEGVLGALTICVRILVSAFGSCLYVGVGDLIASVLETVDRIRWPRLRFKAAKCVIAQSNRIDLHVELVTYLLPYDTYRSRCLTLDVAFLSLWQWSSPSDKDPQPKDVSNVQISSSARSKGVDDLSYTLSDILEIIRSLAEFGKDTDAEWACGVARVLKQAMADPLVLVRGENGELGSVSQQIKKLRTCTRRMPFNVTAVQDLRIALDAMQVAVGELSGESKVARAETLPCGPLHMTQTRLSNVRS